MKKICKTLIMLLACVLLTSCTSKTTEEEKSNPQFSISEYVPLTDIEEGRPNIYLITKVVDSKYWQTLVKGAKDAGNDQNCNVYYAGTNNDTYWEGQITLLDEAVSMGADAIILAPNDSIKLASKIEEIYDSGIPVILVDTVVNSEKFDICYMTENFMAGQQAAEEMIAQLEKAGHTESEEVNVGVLVGADTSQTINERLSGFFEYWEANAPEKWEIDKDLMNCNGDVSYGEELVTEYLKDNHQVDGLYSTNNTPTQALSKIIYQQERKDIVVVGFDYSDDIKTLIENPEYKASTILQKQYDMSYRGVQSAIDILNGKEIEGKFVDTGVITVNNENLSDSEVAEVLSQN